MKICPQNTSYCSRACLFVGHRLLLLHPTQLPQPLLLAVAALLGAVILLVTLVLTGHSRVTLLQGSPDFLTLLFENPWPSRAAHAPASKHAPP